MQLKSEDYKKLKYNVSEIGAKPVLEAFPELTRFPEFMVEVPGADKNILLKYIIYCYDKGSPFVMYEKNLTKRKVLCALEAGWKADKNGKFPEVVQSILGCKLEEVNRMAVRYCRNQKDSRFTLWATGVENLHHRMEKLMDPNITEENKAKVDLKSVIADTTTLEVLADEVFMEDKELVYTADEVMQEEEGKIGAYPEHFAEMQRQGKIVKKNIITGTVGERKK